MTLKQLIADTLLYLEQQPRHARFFASHGEALPTAPAPSLREPVPMTAIPELPPVIIPEKAPKPISAPTPIRQTQHPIRQTLLRIEPTLTLFDHPPPDTQAQHMASGWKEWMPGIQIVILMLHKTPSETVWMQALARAMQNKWGGVKILHALRLEQEKRWDLFFSKNELRLILLSAGSLDPYPELLKYYKSIPAQAIALLNEIPTLHLHPPSTYTPEEKRLLWQKIDALLC